MITATPSPKWPSRRAHSGGPALAVLLALTVGLPAVAAAQDSKERRSPLADAPAIRKRVELREHRFEAGAGFGTTIAQDFYHAVMVNARLGFHINAWLAIAGIGAFNLTPGFKTSFHDTLTTVLPASKQPMDRAPTLAEAQSSMNKIGQAFAVQAELIPFTGKFALFSKLFMNYDFYGFIGP